MQKTCQGVSVSENVVYLFRIKDPGSALTHFAGFWMAVFAVFPMMIRASDAGISRMGMISLSIFMMSMMLLYGASTVYHAFNISGGVNLILKKIDHMMIFVLIAGTYTPVCALMLPKETGLWMLCVIWGIAAGGLVLKACWVTCPKWFSSIIYIAMGWVCVFAMPQIVQALSMVQFIWLLAGGILYTAGGVIYALKLPLFNAVHKHFGSHEIFHLFVMAGSLCHYICIYSYL